MARGKHLAKAMCAAVVNGKGVRTLAERMSKRSKMSTAGSGIDHARDSKKQVEICPGPVEWVMTRTGGLAGPPTMLQGAKLEWPSCEIF